MQNLFYNISQVLGITVVHSLWQGLIVYMLLCIFMLTFPKVPAAVRYRVAFGALTAVLGWFLYTLFLQLIKYEWQSATPVALNPIAFPGLIASSNEAPVNQYYLTIAGYMPYVTVLYVVGLVFNTLKLAFAWNNIYRIRKYIKQTEFASSIRDLSSRLDLKTKVEAAFNEWVDVPCVTGFFKPIILLPISISCYLNTEEVEAILLHELAHVKRNDYLHNFIQQVIGIMLFFNPFARLISKTISEEREHSCDDLVITTTGKPFIYAQTLLKLEENKQYQWQLALAATGKRKFELLNRIERIMKTKKHTINIRPVLVTVLALALGITSIAWLNPKVENGKLKVKNLAPAIEMLTALATGGDISSAGALTPEKAPVTKSKKHKMEIKYNDNTVFTELADTTKKPGKYTKIIIEDENGNRKEYTSAADLPADVRREFSPANPNDSIRNRTRSITKAEYDKWMAGTEPGYAGFDWYAYVNPSAKLLNIEKETDNKLLNSRQNAYERLQNLQELRALEVDKRINSKEFKKRQKAFEKSAAELAKRFDAPEFKKRQLQMVEKSIEVAKKFYPVELDLDEMSSPEVSKNIEMLIKSSTSPKFKEEMEKMEKELKNIPPTMLEGDLAELAKFANGMAKYYNSPAYKKDIKELTKYYESPEYAKWFEGIRKSFEAKSDSLKKR